MLRTNKTRGIVFPDRYLQLTLEQQREKLLKLMQNISMSAVGGGKGGKNGE